MALTRYVSTPPILPSSSLQISIRPLGICQYQNQLVTIPNTSIAKLRFLFVFSVLKCCEPASNLLNLVNNYKSSLSIWKTLRLGHDGAAVFVRTMED